jgi:hypothetical protein
MLAFHSCPPVWEEPWRRRQNSEVSRRTSVEHRQVPHLETGLSTNPIKLDWSCFGARISGSMLPAGKKFKNFICVNINGFKLAEDRDPNLSATRWILGQAISKDGGSMSAKILGPDSELICGPRKTCRNYHSAHSGEIARSRSIEKNARAERITF